MERRSLLAKVKQQRQALAPFFEVGWGHVFWKSEVGKGDPFGARPVLAICASCVRGDPSGREGLRRVHVLDRASLAPEHRKASLARVRCGLLSSLVARALAAARATPKQALEKSALACVVC
jgi:hypothetical protein